MPGRQSSPIRSATQPPIVTATTMAAIGKIIFGILISLIAFMNNTVADSGGVNPRHPKATAGRGDAEKFV